MARVTPAPGQTVKETTLTEILPSTMSEPAHDKRHPEYWSWMESIDENYCSQHKVKTYLHRLIDPEGAARKPNLEAIDVFESPLTQSYIIRTFGGGHYRLMTHVDGQLRYDELFRVAGKPKETGSLSTHAPGSGGLPNSELGLLAQILQQQNQLFKELLDRNNSKPMIDEAVRNAMTLSSDVFRGGVETVRATLGAPAVAAPNPMNDVMMQFMTAAISKMMNPADPIEQFGKMASAMAAINPSGGGGGTSWGVEAVRAIGQALPSIAQAITSYSAAAMRPPMPPNGRTIDVTQPAPMRANADDRRFDPQPADGKQPAQALPEPTPISAAAPAKTAPPPQGGEVQSPNFEWLETRIVALVNNPELSPQDAASETLTFLQSAAPAMLPQLCNEASLRWLFANRTILQHIPNDARRERFIQHFLAFASGQPLPPDEVAAPAPAKPDDGLLLTPEPPPAS